MHNGLHILYSPVNQAYFLMWCDIVLHVFNEKWEAEAELSDILKRKGA